MESRPGHLAHFASFRAEPISSGHARKSGTRAVVVKSMRISIESVAYQQLLRILIPEFSSPNSHPRILILSAHLAYYVVANLCGFCVAVGSCAMHDPLVVSQGLPVPIVEVTPQLPVCPLPDTSLHSTPCEVAATQCKVGEGSGFVLSNPTSSSIAGPCA